MIDIRIANSTISNGLNYIKSSLYARYDLERLTPFPRSIYIIPIRKCNARCIMCLNWRDKEEYIGDLVYWKKLVDELVKITPYSKVNLSGGEILLPGLLKELAFYAVKKLPFTGITSNGFLIDEKMSKKLIELKFSNINISIDGILPKTVNVIRGRPDAFIRTENAVKFLVRECKLQSSKTKIIIKTIIMGLNINELPDLVEKVVKLGAHGVYFQPIEPIYNSNQTLFQLKKTSLWVNNKSRAESTLNKLVEMKKNGYPILNDNWHFEMIRNYFGLVSSVNSLENEPKRCEIELSNLFILPEGNVHFCPDYPPIGNIKSQSLKDILFSRKAIFQRKLIRSCPKIKKCLSTCKVNKGLGQQVKFFFFLNSFRVILTGAVV